MNKQRSIRRIAVAGLLGFTLLAASCGNDKTDTASTTKAPDTTAANSGSGSSTDGPSGPGCSAVPADGAGSFAGMAVDPAATAASNNPVLSTLVSAVKAADLVDTLNGPGPFTIFAPTNDAFAKIPADTLNSVLADKATLTKILTLHVVPGKMSAADLVKAGKATTVEGQDITFSGDASSLKVNGQATVVCGDVQVANATVHIIDTVLMPS
ncbi:MAG: fasciclin domain-containing protein [Acidimicrobiales bacterium]